MAGRVGDDIDNFLLSGCFCGEGGTVMEQAMTASKAAVNLVFFMYSSPFDIDNFCTLCGFLNQSVKQIEQSRQDQIERWQASIGFPCRENSPAGTGAVREIAPAKSNDRQDGGGHDETVTAETVANNGLLFPVFLVPVGKELRRSPPLPQAEWS